MGPGVQVDPNRTRNVTSDEAWPGQTSEGAGHRVV